MPGGSDGEDRVYLVILFLSVGLSPHYYTGVVESRPVYFDVIWDTLEGMHW